MPSKQLTPTQLKVLSHEACFNTADPDPVNLVAMVESILKQTGEPDERKHLIWQQVTSLVMAHKPRAIITKAEESALEALRNDTSILILPADKGRSPVVLDKTDYVQKASTLPEDRQAYLSRGEESIKTLVTQLEKTLADMQSNKAISKSVRLAIKLTDAPYSTLMAEILRPNSVSDRQRYHQFLKEESMGNRKLSEFLRQMRSLLGDMQVDDKFVKMFLERLPADVQTILASGAQDLTVSQLPEMADRMIERLRLLSPSVAQVFTSSSTVNEQLMKQVSAMADKMASLKLQLARLTSSRSRSRRRSRSRPRTADTFCPNGETSQPENRRDRYFRLFQLCWHLQCLRHYDSQMFPGGHWSPNQRFFADRRFPSAGLHLQTANRSPIPTFSRLSLTLNIGLRRSFTWILAIADVPHAIRGSDFLAECDLFVDCRRARPRDRTTGLSARGLTPFTAPTNLSVLDTDIASPFRQLLLRHPNLSNTQFRSGEVQHDVMHHIRTSGPPVFVRQRRLAQERLQAAKAEFEHML
nr:unnamed protein product [Spirometra erinaceieuropaei]